MKNILRVALPPIFTAIALLLVWEIAVVVFKPAAYLLPSPLAILRAANIDSRQLINATWNKHKRNHLALLGKNGRALHAAMQHLQRVNGGLVGVLHIALFAHANFHARAEVHFQIQNQQPREHGHKYCGGPLTKSTRQAK